MTKSLQGRFREVIHCHNNYTLYYFVYMYTQICDENALFFFRYTAIHPLDDHYLLRMRGDKRHKEIIINSVNL